MIAWMLPGAVAASVLGALYALAPLVAPTRRFLPELSVLAVVVLALALGLAPLDPTRLVLWGWAAWRPVTAALLVLGVAWTQIRSERTGPVPATEALALGFLVGAVPATAVVASRAHDPAHAARLAVLATAASALSPVGGPAHVLLWDRDLTGLVAPAAAVLVALAWPWGEIPSRPGLAWREALPGLLGIPFGWAFGTMAGVGAYAAGAAMIRCRAPSPEVLAEGRPLRAALAAIAVTALLQVAGIPWGAAWMADLGDRVPVVPGVVAACAALPALFLDPFAAAAIADRVASQPSAPGHLAPVLALPLLLVPGPALFVAAAVHGRGTLRWGVPLALVAVALAVGAATLLG